MAAAAFFYTPANGESLVGVNLQESLNGRDGPYVSYKSSSATSLGGQRYIRLYAGVERIVVRKTIMRDQDTTRASDINKVIRKLRGMIAHLKRGGCVAFTEDLAHMCAAFVSNQPGPGVDYLLVGERITKELAGGGSFVDRECVIRTDPDRLLLEEKLCDAYTSSTNRADFESALFEDYSEARWILLRESGTYPALRLPEDALGRDDFLTHTEDLTYELELPLEDDIDELERLARLGGQIGSESVIVGGKGVPPGNYDPNKPPVYRYWS